MNKIKKIKETCLYIKDLDITKRFYHDILGFPIINRKEGRHIFFRVGEDVLLCFIPEVTKFDTHLPPHYAYGEQHLAFEVSTTDYDAIKFELENQGIEIIHLQTWRGDIKSFYFKDPNDHLLEIVCEGLWD